MKEFKLKIPPLEAEGHLYRWVSKYWEINFPTTILKIIFFNPKNFPIYFINISNILVDKPDDATTIFSVSEAAA